MKKTYFDRYLEEQVAASAFAAAISIEPVDVELSTFNQRGVLGKAHQLFGEQLHKLLDELNEVLAA